MQALAAATWQVISKVKRERQENDILHSRTCLGYCEERSSSEITTKMRDLG